MSMQFKETGPVGVKRPFSPTIEITTKLTTDQRMTEALEHIAVSLSAIDHNIERLVTLMTAQKKA